MARVVEHIAVGPQAPDSMIVAYKPRHEPWDNSDPAVVRARLAYERGEIEMMTTRVGNEDHMYAIPRKYAVSHRKGFWHQNYMGAW